MSEHFIKNIEIKNFKCFEDFKAEGFGRVNLIGGKNNVGKTAFMEACWIHLSAKNIKSFTAALSDIKFMRENLNIFFKSVSNDTKKFMEKSNNISIQSNVNYSSFSIDEKNGIKEYVFKFDQNSITVNSNQFSFEMDHIENMSFIDNFGLSNIHLNSAYAYLQKKDEEEYLNKLINKFDETIESFKVINDIPQCKKNQVYVEITEFGDGLRHLISIVTSLYKCENGYLFIDELENGVHYTKLDELWKIILHISDKLNVQVFATTHSKECIESYARIAKKLEDEEITFIELGKNKDNEIKAMVYPYEWFMDEIEQNHEVRGW